MTVAALWPWLAVAAVGALHGLNPAGGWLLAAACGVRAGDRAQVVRALVPIGGGHLLSVGLVVAAVTAGVADYGVWMVGGALLLWVGALVLRKRRGAASLAVSAFIASTLYGAGLMLVPAVASVCLSGTPARELVASGSIVIGVAAVGVHMLAMLAVTGVLAAVVIPRRRAPRPHAFATRNPATPAHMNTNA